MGRGHSPPGPFLLPDLSRGPARDCTSARVRSPQRALSQSRRRFGGDGGNRRGTPVASRDREAPKRSLRSQAPPVGSPFRCAQRKPPLSRRTLRKPTRWTPEEWAQVERAAAARGVPPLRYVREAALGIPVTP